MRKLFIFNIVGLVFILISCSQIDMSKLEVSQPKHIIVGKWESKQTPTLKLNFNEENTLAGEFLGLNGHLYKYNYQYLIIDETKVEMIDTSAGPKVIIQATIYGDKMSFHCDYKRLPNEPLIVDFPTLCNYHEFTKVK